MKRFGFLLISISLTFAVFGFSSQSGETSSSLSLQIAQSIQNIIQSLIPSIHLDLIILHTVLRKTAHVLEYAVLGISYTVTLLAFKKSLWITLPIGLGIALIDEGLQFFSIERGPSLIDALLFDFPGIILGTIFVFLILKIGSKKNVS